MPIVLPCPKCKAKLKGPDQLVGRTLKCPGCGTPVLITAAAVVPPPAAPPPSKPPESKTPPAPPPPPKPAAPPAAPKKAADSLSSLDLPDDVGFLDDPAPAAPPPPKKPAAPPPKPVPPPPPAKKPPHSDASEMDVPDDVGFQDDPAPAAPPPPKKAEPPKKAAPPSKSAPAAIPDMEIDDDEDDDEPYSDFEMVDDDEDAEEAYEEVEEELEEELEEVDEPPPKKKVAPPPKKKVAPPPKKPEPPKSKVAPPAKKPEPSKIKTAPPPRKPEPPKSKAAPPPRPAPSKVAKDVIPNMEIDDEVIDVEMEAEEEIIEAQLDSNAELPVVAPPPSPKPPADEEVIDAQLDEEEVWVDPIADEGETDGEELEVVEDDVPELEVAEDSVDELDVVSDAGPDVSFRVLKLPRLHVRSQSGMFSMTNAYDLVNPKNKKKVGEAVERPETSQQLLSLFVSKNLTATKIEVTEGHNDLVLTVRRAPYFLKARAEIFDADDEKIGSFDILPFSALTGTPLWITDPNDRQLIKMEMKMFSGRRYFRNKKDSLLAEWVHETTYEKKLMKFKLAPRGNSFYLIWKNALDERPLDKMLILGASLGMDLFQTSGRQGVRFGR